MDQELPILYVKSGCEGCAEARDFLMGQGISHREVNVTDDEKANGQMVRVSGQANAPTLDWHGAILADFTVDELVTFLHEHDVVMQDS